VGNVGIKKRCLKEKKRKWGRYRGGGERGWEFREKRLEKE